MGDVWLLWPNGTMVPLEDYTWADYQWLGDDYQRVVVTRYGECDQPIEWKNVVTSPP